MKSEATTVDEYMSEVPEDRKEALVKLRNTILDNLPKGFKEEMGYGMPGYVVPKSIYPPGYQCDPNVPLPFMGFASQKNDISFYHMGMYADQGLYDWFIDAVTMRNGKKPNVGKSCIRFRKSGDIPYELIGELVAKISVEDWIKTYEEKFLRRKS